MQVSVIRHTVYNRNPIGAMDVTIALSFLGGLSSDFDGDECINQKDYTGLTWEIDRIVSNCLDPLTGFQRALDMPFINFETIHNFNWKEEWFAERLSQPNCWLVSQSIVLTNFSMRTSECHRRWEELTKCFI